MPAIRCERCGSDNLCARFEPVLSINLQPDNQEIKIGELLHEWYEVECMTCGLVLANENVPAQVVTRARALYEAWIKHHRPS